MTVRMPDGYFGDRFLENLIEKCDESRDPKKRERDKALVAALFLTGGHVQEVLKLRKNNFDFQNDEADRHNAFLVRNMPVQRYQTKEGKRKLVTRTVPIWRDDPLVQYLLEWVEKVKDYLFPSTGGKDPFMTRQGANHVIKTLGQRLDMPVYITSKDLREQRMYYLAERKGFSPYDIQAYVRLRSPPAISGSREDWQNLLYVANAKFQPSLGKREDVEELMKRDEDIDLEFKSTLRYDMEKRTTDTSLERDCLKAICAFLNTGGGILLIGVSDDKKVIGLSHDFETFTERKDADGFENHVVNQIWYKIGKQFLSLIDISFYEIGSRTVCQVGIGSAIRSAYEPAFLKEGKKQTFFIRTGNSSRPLSMEDAARYIRKHWRV